MKCKHFERRRDESLARNATDLMDFYDKAVLALLPAAMKVQGWKLQGVSVASGEARIDLAFCWAYLALKKRFPDHPWDSVQHEAKQEA